MGPGPWALAHGPWPMGLARGPWPMGPAHSPWPMGSHGPLAHILAFFGTRMHILVFSHKPAK